MRHVVRLEAPIIEILDVPEGETVGYSSNFIAMRPSRIATLSCGYADGYPRNGGSKPGKPGGAALIAGRECPFAGNVSMDLITVDITDLPEGSVAEGDFATLIGDGLDLDRVGQSAGTIGYEILTNLGRRYNRLAVERNR
jgi:alanine racemase